MCIDGGTKFQICARTCQSSCRDLSQQSASYCIEDCYPGCDCEPGYYKAGSGQCVAKAECTCWNPYQPNDPEIPAGTEIETHCQKW